MERDDHVFRHGAHKHDPWKAPAAKVENEKRRVDCLAKIRLKHMRHSVNLLMNAGSNQMYSLTMSTHLHSSSHLQRKYVNSD